MDRDEVEHAETDRHRADNGQEHPERLHKDAAAVHPDEQIQAVGDEGGDEVRERTGERGQRHAPAAVFEVRDIDRNGPRPAEAEQQQTHKAHRVDMGKGRKGDAAGVARGAVPEQVGRRAVRRLVHRKAQHDRRQRKRERDECRAQISAQNSS